MNDALKIVGLVLLVILAGVLVKSCSDPSPLRTQQQEWRGEGR